MNTFLCIAYSIISYIILIILSSTILGMIVRGINKPSFLRTTMDYVLSIIFLIVAMVYLYALYFFWNIGLFAAGLILIAVRVPDLRYEMKTGEKSNTKNMRKRPIDIIFSIIGWLVLILVWYSLCLI